MRKITGCNMGMASILLLSVSMTANAEIALDPSIDSTDVSVTQVVVNSVTYDLVSVEGYPLTPELAEGGEPQIPNLVHNYILPNDMEIAEIQITSMQWDTLSGSYYLYPVQNTSMEDSTFVLPDSSIYDGGSCWPLSPIKVLSQSDMMGVGIASIRTTPLLYIPGDSLLLSLSSITVSISYTTRCFDTIVPVSETSWSYDNRVQGILASVQNPGDYSSSEVDMYRRQLENQNGPLVITSVPSPDGDGVDFVIITTDDFVDEWRDLADIRIKQGIITVVKSVEWIESEYKGCDTQEKIKNFITDAYEFWGTSVFLLGGDHELIPSRMCLEILSGGHSSFPCDWYYADVNVDEGASWVDDMGYWSPPDLDVKQDVIVGRISAMTETQVEDFVSKIQLYENPASLPSGYPRSAVFIGDSDTDAGYGEGAVPLEALNQDLITAGISGSSGTYLNTVTELYWPPSGATWSGGLLNRNNVIDAVEDGAHLIFHAAHSGTHLLGAQSAQYLPARQYLTEGDIQELDNSGEPSILLSVGCWPGHFQGANCIIERGLLSSYDAGLIAAMAFSKNGAWGDIQYFCHHFANALFEFESYSGSGSQVMVGPYRYLGESYRHMMNNIWQLDEYYMNLFGDPSMFVWRGNAIRPTVTANPSTVTAGTFSTTIHVAELGVDLAGAKVCLYKEDELFAIGTTDANGDAAFTNIQVATAGTITATVTKRKAGTEIVNYLPATTSITVNQSTGALVCLDDLTVDDDDVFGTYGNDDGEVNPGETIKFDLVVSNEGTSSATNATATLSIVSGSDQVEIQIDMTERLGTVPTGATTYSGAFSLEIADDVEAGSDPVILQVAFSYDQGSRNDPADFRVLVGDLDLPIRTMTITQANPLVINIDDMFITNAGLGNLEDVEVEFANATGGVTFTGDLSESFGDLSNGTGEEVEDGITAILRDPSGYWNPINSNAYFDLEVTHRWGSEIISVHAIDIINQGTVQPPSSNTLTILDTDHESIGFKWGYTSSGQEPGFYLWEKATGESNWTRNTTFALDPALRHGTVEDLSAGTEYDVGVSVLGQYGQESTIASIRSSTTCNEVLGWPVYLDGSTGTGPAITDIDGDGYNEVIAATSAGSVYIIELNGTMTKIYDSSYLFSGVAIGDAISGGRDEIVVSGWDYDAATGKKAVVVVLSWAQYIGWSGTAIDADEDSDQRIHENLTVPVIFDADGSGNLEIALRTFNGGYSGNTSSWLYVWEYANSQWGDINGNFPLELDDGEWEYAPPVYIGDTDSDGNAELVISDGEEALLWIEPETFQTSSWDVSSVFPANYDWNLGQSFMVAIKEGATTKLIAVGRDQISLTHGNYATACMNAGNSGSSIWVTGVNQTYDYYGNFGGPAIGDVDGDSDLDIANQWITSSDRDGIIEFLTLSSGSRSTLTDVPHNEQCEDYAMSPVIMAGESGDGLAVFGSTSTVSHGSRFRSSTSEFIPGSSYWSEDRCPSTPVVGNLDGDSDLEVIFADDSGVLHALDMDLDASSGDWPTLQHDLQRTGYYNFTAKNSVDSSLDFTVVSAEKASTTSLSGEGELINVTIDIDGANGGETRDVNCALARETSQSASVSESSRDHARLMAEADAAVLLSPVQETVLVAVFAGREIVDISRIELEDGLREVALTVSRRFLEDELTIVVDPFGDYQECDEANNTLRMLGLQRASIEALEISPSRSGLSVSIPGSAVSGSLIQAYLYSIDGRCVSSETIETIPGEGFSVTLSSDDGLLPFGCYVILMNDGEENLLRRKVLVID